MGGFSTVSAQIKSPIKTLILSATDASGDYTVTATRTIYLNRKIRITRFSGSGLSIHWGASYSYGTGFRSETPDLIVDGVTNPSLPVEASQYVRIQKTVSNMYGVRYGVCVVISAEVDYEELS